MHELSGKPRKPDWKESREVLNMQHLVRCVEHMSHNSWEDTTNLFGYGMRNLHGREEPEPEDADAFKDRFYGAMYRLLLAGAVLVGAYTEPFLRAREEGGMGFLGRSAKPYKQYLDDDMEYLR
jgi:hypothetical protein